MKIGNETYNHCIRCCRTLPNPSLSGTTCNHCIAADIRRKQAANKEATPTTNPNV